MKNKKWLYVIFLAGILILSCFMASAEEVDPPETEIEEDDLVTVVRRAVTIDRDFVEIDKGEGLKLTAYNLLNSDPISWSSSNSCVVVTSQGYIRGVSSGTAIVTASIPYVSGGYTNIATCTVTVSANAIIQSGTYAFMSEYSIYNAYYACEFSRNPGANTKVFLDNSLGKTGCLWIVNLGNDGFYTIRSTYSMKLLWCNNNSSSPNTPIYRSTSTSAGSKWSVIEDVNGMYSFVPSTSLDGNVCLGVTVSNDMEYYMVLRTPLSSDPGKTRWTLLGMLPTNGEEHDPDDFSWGSDTTSYQYAIYWCHPIGRTTGTIGHVREGWATEQELESSEADASLIISTVEDDFDYISAFEDAAYSFYEIGQYEQCGEGEYKVALAVGSGGHRWYRQDANGFWSYWDEDAGEPKDIDEWSDAIIDPQYAYFEEYATFIGYFAVTPWN